MVPRVCLRVFGTRPAMSSIKKAPRLNLQKLKVRPRKEKNAGPCAAEMAAMLGCWASHGDDPDAAECAAFASNLKTCMNDSVRLSFLVILHVQREY